MAIPVASAMRQMWPDAHIAWGVDERCQDVLDKTHLLNETIVVPRQRWKDLGAAAWREQLLFYTRLRQHRFDIGIDLQGHSKTGIFMRFASPKLRLAAHATDIFAKTLSPLAIGSPRGKHVVDWNLEVARQLRIEAQTPNWIMPPVQRMASNRLVTIGVGAGAKNKTIPPDHLITVAKDLMKTGYEIVFLGGRGEYEPDLPNAKTLVGKLTLRESMGWIASSALHIAADTGNGHIAAAYKIPTVSVFGPTDPLRYRPYGELSTVLRAESRQVEDVSPAEILAASLTCLEAHRSTLSH
jgi:ADP-heptose:LPS heptosyltransferase